MRRHTSFAAILFALSLAACASGGAGRSLARLEQEQRAQPGSFAVNRAIGVAYYRAGRYAEARAPLETASRLDPKDGTTALYLGLAAEELGDLAAAKRAYSTYLDVGRTSRVRLQLQSRLAALTRRELAAEAKRAVQQESALGGAVGSPTTVAVMPLRFTGSDSSLRPLERGLADLLTTDLARSSQLTVVERARIQALLDEMALQRSGQTDSSTGVQAGRLLRAGRIVQGSILQIGGSQVRVDAAVVDVSTTEVRRAPTSSSSSSASRSGSRSICSASWASRSPSPSATRSNSARRARSPRFSPTAEGSPPKIRVATTTRAASIVTRSASIPASGRRCSGTAKRGV